jgi:serine/threonine protein phosphatase PrpC
MNHNEEHEAGTWARLVVRRQLTGADWAMSTSTQDSSGAQECPVCSADSAGPAAVGPDGYCETCGRKVPVGRDHAELDLGLLAGVTDRGLRHERNEDAMALATANGPLGPVALAVVSDGVSSAPRPDEASLTAVRTAMRLLLKSTRAGEDPVGASAAAAKAGARALNELVGPEGAPAATYVSAVVTTEVLTVCWLGDSRAYWLTANPADCVRLTRDDSLAEEIVAAGLASVDEAMASPQAHVITRWLGADLPEPQPHVAQFTPPGPGVLLICSDGLWNYRPEAADLAALALPAALTDPQGAAAAMVKFAVESGGIDNITAVLIPFPLNTGRADHTPTEPSAVAASENPPDETRVDL